MREARAAGASTPGYSGTPLAKKLGIKPSHRLLVIDAPSDYESMVDPLPSGVEFGEKADPGVDLVHAFVTESDVLERMLGTLRRQLRPDAAIWISWPKRSSKLATTVTEDVIRDVALPLGLVDIKVCAVSDVWSALKLVVRKELRQAPPTRRAR